MTSPRRAVVIGAGISGLACAWRLREMGVETLLLEADERPGGLVETVARNGFLFEAGPQSFQPTPELHEWIQALGLEGELVEADPRASRYILLGGKLHPAPMSPPQLLSTPLVSARTKLRLLAETFRRTRPPEEDESLADFVRRKFGAELLEHLAGPFVSGVYAGDPERLSLRSTFPTVAQWEAEYGSVIRGAMKSRAENGERRPLLSSFRKGNAQLAGRAAERLGDALRTGTRVEQLAAGAGPAWRIRAAERAEEISADAVIVATPAYAAAHFVLVASPPLARAFAAFPYAPVAVVALGFRREQAGHELSGFGFLVSHKERLRTLGTVWNTSLFPGRAPEGMVLLTSFVGGATDPQIVQMEPDWIAATVRNEIGRVLRISGPPAERQVWRHPRALPQYNLGHAKRVEMLRQQLALLPGIFATGNYLEGPSLGNCVAQGFRTAQAVRDFLAR